MSTLLERAARSAREALRTNAPVDPELHAASLGEKEWLALRVLTKDRRGRWINVRKSWGDALERCVAQMREHFKDVDLATTPFCIVLEWVRARGEVEFAELQQTAFDDKRFEPGITGFCFRPRNPKAKGAPPVVHYTPIDAWLRGHHSVNQLTEGLPKDLRAALEERPEECRVIRTNSEACLVQADGTASELLRGMPPAPPWTVSSVTEILRATAQWLADHRHADGRFWYYYDPARDSLADHAHPILKERYYNWVRHGLALLPLLDAVKRFGRKDYLPIAHESLRAMIDHSYVYERPALGPGRFEGKRRATLCNQKAKLGASSCALIATVEYYEQTRDEALVPEMWELVRHLDSQILANGELQGYFIHPRYDGGKPLYDLSDQARRELFSFYYPGEALLGMVRFLFVVDLEEKEREYLRQRIELALDYLLVKRPVDYKELFTSLPSDAWLVQAIEILTINGFKSEAALAFVREEMRQLTERMYREDDTPYPDYAGGFNYRHGDLVYVDGARMEGFFAAHRLFERIGDREMVAKLRGPCEVGARSLLLLYNTTAHGYSYPRPEHAKGTWRLKFTRQWTRIDNSGHCYASLMGALDAKIVPE